jgi:signal transduction histidine kinase
MLERKAASLETLFTFPDGATRWFEIRVEPVPEGICIHSVDIQSRKEAETLLREQENVASLGRMAAVVAHELKNPLAGLSGALQVLKEQRSPVDRDVPLFDEMLKSIQSLDRLIRDLLVFAKPLQIEPQPISMEEIVRSALSYFDGDRALKPHSVHLSVEHPPPIVSADQELLKNVFRNLLLNAAQAMQEAGSIDVCVSRHESTCRVTVADNGPGIPPELASRIFQPFVTGRKGGTGLGLAISRRLLRLHGGDLELLTTPSPGAAFRATVPLHGAT